MHAMREKQHTCFSHPVLIKCLDFSGQCCDCMCDIRQTLQTNTKCSAPSLLPIARVFQTLTSELEFISLTL